MPKHYLISGMPVALSLQLVFDSLGLPEHGGESWTVLSEEVKGSVNRYQSTIVSKMQ